MIQPRQGLTASTPADDVEALKNIVCGKDTLIAELEKRNELLMEQLSLLRKYRFARSSEKWSAEDRQQLRMFDEAESGFRPVAEKGPETE